MKEVICRLKRYLDNVEPSQPVIDWNGDTVQVIFASGFAETVSGLDVRWFSVLDVLVAMSASSRQLQGTRPRGTTSLRASQKLRIRERRCRKTFSDVQALMGNNF